MVSQSDTSAPKPDKHFVDATEGHEGCVMVVSAPHGTSSMNDQASDRAQKLTWSLHLRHSISYLGWTDDGTGTGERRASCSLERKV